MDKRLKDFYQFGRFRLDGSECLLLRDGEVVSLTPKAFDLLKIMVERPGELLTKDELLQAVWPGTFVEENNLADNISKLRKALGDGDNGQRFIETVPKRGYRFAAPVEVVHASPQNRSRDGHPADHLETSHSKSLIEKSSRSRIATIWVLAGLTLFVVVLAGSYYGVRWVREGSHSSPATLRPFAQVTSGRGWEGLPTWSPDGRKIAYCSDRGGNFDIWVQAISGGEPLQVTKSPEIDCFPDWSPDGSKIAFRSERDGGGIYIVPELGGSEQRLTSFGYHPQWSPDGKRILFSDNPFGFGLEKAFTVGLDETAPVPVQPKFFGEFIFGGIKWFGWHPDAQRLSVWGDHGKLGRGFWTIPIDGGKPVKSEIPAEIESQIKSSNVSLQRFGWAPSRKFLYFGGSDSNVHSIWRVGVDPETLKWLTAPERLTNDTGRCNDLALSPDGKKLAYQICDRKGQIWAARFDSITGELKSDFELISDSAKQSWAEDLSRDGKKLSFGVWRSAKLERWEKSLEQGSEQLLATEGNAKHLPGFWSPDGSKLVALRMRDQGPRGSQWSENTIVVYPAGGGDEQVIASPTIRNFHGDDWSADGKWILARDSPGNKIAGPSFIELLPIDAAPKAENKTVIVTSSDEYDMWNPRLSPDEHWVSFNATKKTGERRKSVVYVVPKSGGKWTRITEGQYWDDVPRWSADGKILYFTSDRSGAAWSANIWGIKVNPIDGEPVGSPFQVTSFVGDRFMWLTDSAYAIRGNRLIVNLYQISGNIWMLENVDR